ncbi:MAG: hypothetical protein ACJ0H0_03345 [Vicinamibacterales bacterium]
MVSRRYVLFSIVLFYVIGKGIALGQQPLPPAGRIAVTPFVNITGNTADDWIGVGIADTVTAELERITSQTVIRLSENHLLDGGNQEVVSAARELNVQWIVSGSYQRMDNQLRLAGRLSTSITREVLTSTLIDGPLDQLFALQDQLVTELLTGLAQQDRVTESTRTAPSGGTVDRLNRQPEVTEARSLAPPDPTAIDGPPPPIAPATINRDTEGRATVRAVRLTEPMEIDGVLDETMYSTVESFSGFIQQSPDEGAPATERTEAWVFFDDNNIYVSARLWDSAPESQWVANEMQRDSFQLINNERFSVAFDTFYDRRNNVAFMVNPIGGFLDQEITDESRPNTDWNAVWDVRTGRFNGGWTAEMEIPFKSLRFSQEPLKSGEYKWGAVSGGKTSRHISQQYRSQVDLDYSAPLQLPR